MHMDDAWVAARVRATEVARDEGRISPEVAAIRIDQINGVISDAEAEHRIGMLYVEEDRNGE
jgi:hypothetical protein